VSLKAIIVKDGKILLLQNRSTRKEWDKTWGIPGGLIEYDEPIESCLKREITEETGLKVDVVKIIGLADSYVKSFIFENGTSVNPRFVHIIHLCNYTSGKVKLSDEHHKYKWVYPQDVMKYFSETSHKSQVKKILNEYLA
jgi:8-oxo-dGTP diphosphatase